MFQGNDDVQMTGIKLAYLLKFASGLPREFLNDATTKDVCDYFVIPATQEKKMSFVETLDSSEIGKPAVFISHAWQYKFKAVVEALEKYFKTEPDVIVWFDVFCANQHQATNRDFHWWTTTFKNSIAAIGRTVMVLAPWNDPVPLTRGWCIWELFCTIEAKNQFDIAMTTDSYDQFVEDMDSNAGDAVYAMIGKINCASFTCSVVNDKTQIHKAIQSQGGFLDLDRKIFDAMKEWIIRAYERVVMIRKTYLGPDHYNSLHALIQLGALYETRGDDELAERSFQECLDRASWVLGSDHFLTLMAMSNLAMHRLRSSRESSEQMLRNAFHGLKETVGPNHVNTITTMVRLALVYVDMTRYDEAQSLFEKCLQLCEDHLGLTHGQTLLTMYHLAGLYYDRGKYQQAEVQLLECVKRQKQTIGADHPATSKSMHHLALVFQSQGKYKDAEALYKECLEASQVKFGREHSETLAIILNLAGLYRLQRKLELAETFLRRCLEVYQRIFGPDNHQTLSALSSLAGLYYEQQKYDLAEPIFLECLKKQLKTRKLGDSVVVKLKFNLGKLYHKTDAFAEAEKLFQECVIADKDRLGVNHIVTLTAMGSLANVYVHQKRYDLAEPLILECDQRLKGTVGQLHDRSLDIASLLSFLYLVTNRQALAIELSKQTLKNCEDAFGIHDFRTDEARENYERAVHGSQNCINK
jgi:tetratricopeptide (TPR) repeat protein